MKKALLLVIAEPEVHDLFRGLCLCGKVQMTVAESAHALLQEKEWDLVLLHAGNDPSSGLELLRQIKFSYPAVPVVFLTETSSENLAIAAFRCGAKDYHKWPVDMVRLMAIIENLLELRRRGSERRNCVPLEGNLSGPVGELGKARCIPLGLLRVLGYIEQHLHECLTLESLSREAGLSRHSLCRAFQKALGTTPMRFVCFRRVLMAKRLLRRDDLNVSEVARKSGFGNLNNLNKWFKIYEGMTPVRYRSRVRVTRTN
jgi:AraC-like DNA-binding protein/CheY-like chemotaxis protein